MATSIIDALKTRPLTFRLRGTTLAAFYALKWGSGLIALFALGYLVRYQPSTLQEIAVVGGVALLSSGGFVMMRKDLRRASQTVTVSLEGLMQTIEGKPPLTIRWADVAALRDRAFSGTFDVQGREPGAIIKIDRDIEGFHVLRDIISFQTQAHAPTSERAI